MDGFEEQVGIMGEWTMNDDSVAIAYSGSETTQVVLQHDLSSMGNHELKMGSRGCLRERMAARAGFDALKLNMGNIRSADLSKNLPETQSPCLTIPSGLSPTCLLDSPVFVSNSWVFPSPTTGKFPFAPVVNNQNSTKENAFDEDTSSFAFKPIAESGSIPQFNASNSMHYSGFAPQSLPSVTVSVHPKTSVKQNADPPASIGVMENSPRLDELCQDDEDQRSSGDPNVAEDGYNWRKYGQKQVKGSEYPRSYYKCTYSNCPVKKKVERAHEGHITEIIYKGNHNHPMPNHRSSIGLESESGTGTNLDLIQTTAPAGWVQEYGGSGQHELGEVVDQSLTFSNDEDEGDHVTHGSVSLGGYDGEGDELESKRRRIDVYAADMTGATRAIREPRVVVQTTSDVDILDDGYRWRKYGQKVVKGNPNPRSYYKCTSGGCNVRKHVERASHDLKSVITTYEGKHNHDVPAARNSNSNNNVGGNINGVVASQQPLQIQNRSERLPTLPLPLGLPMGFRFGTNHPGLASSIGGGLGIINQGKFPALSLPLHHHHSMNGMSMGLVLPKLEPITDPSVVQGAAAYQHLMSQMPHI